MRNVSTVYSRHNYRAWQRARGCSKRVCTLACMTVYVPIPVTASCIHAQVYVHACCISMCSRSHTTGDNRLLILSSEVSCVSTSNECSAYIGDKCTITMGIKWDCQLVLCSGCPLLGGYKCTSYHYGKWECNLSFVQRLSSSRRL